MTVLLPYVGPVLAGVFQAGVSHEAVADALEEGLLDIVELRLDTFPYSDIPSIVSDFELTFPDVPTIATIRSSNEGGQWSGSESLKFNTYQQVISSVSAIDVEWNSAEHAQKAVAMAHDHGRDVIASYHQFEPGIDVDFLSHLIEDAMDFGADFVKIACMVSDDSDINALSYLLQHYNHHPIIIIGMGEHGVQTRKAFPSMGSRIAFAAIGEASAPGQLTLTEMRPFVTPSENIH